MDRSDSCSAIGVLLVDDDVLFRTSLAEMLRDDGHVVWDYDAPADVPEPSAGPDPAVLVSDYDMPGKSGIAFADELHARRRLPVLLVTAYRTRTIDAQVASRPFMRLLEKPIDYEDLHAMVHELRAAASASSEGQERP